MIIQWDGDLVKIMPADGSVSIATADCPVWEADGVDCLSGKAWEGEFLDVTDFSIKPIQEVGSSTCLNGGRHRRY